jgi:hypothetical protein
MTVDKRLIDLIMGNAGSERNPFANVWDRAEPPPRLPMGGVFGSLAASNPLTDVVNPPANGLFGSGLPVERPVLVPAPRPEPVKRKVYFAFAYSDILRVNNVRHVGKISPAREQKNVRTFLDRSMWETRKRTNPEGLKNLMRGAIKYSSAVCVLIGTYTWRSRWAKYEIARSVVDQKGLFAVHLNSLNHDQRQAPDPLGYSPLHVMGIFREFDGKYYLYEKQPVVTDPTTGQLGWEWGPYEDFKDPVPLPRYSPPMEFGKGVPLAAGTAEYDFMGHGGYKNIGAWIDDAAIAVGR